MNEEELLLKDLSARIIYHNTVCSIYREDDFKIGWRDAELTGYFFDGSSYEFYFDCCSSVNNILKIKPYLRPMSSMTEEERNEYNKMQCVYGATSISKHGEMTDWLNANHFDYRGLIERGLAIAVTEENNPYK